MVSQSGPSSGTDLERVRKSAEETDFVSLGNGLRNAQAFQHPIP